LARKCLRELGANQHAGEQTTNQYVVRAPKWPRVASCPAKARRVQRKRDQQDDASGNDHRRAACEDANRDGAGADVPEYELTAQPSLWGVRRPDSLQQTGAARSEQELAETPDQGQVSNKPQTISRTDSSH
jgi:hypothetical protein